MNSFLDWPTLAGRHLLRRCLRPLRRPLRRTLPERHEQVLAAIYHQANSIRDISREWVKDDASRTHLTVASAIVGAYKVLSSEIGDEQSAADLVQKTIIHKSKSLLHDIVSSSYALSANPIQTAAGKNPFKRLAETAPRLIRDKYGETFVTEFETDGSTSFSITISKCFFFDFFRDHGLPQMAEAFCRRNSTRLEQNRPRHGISIDFTSAMGCGDPICKLSIAARRP